MPAPAQRSKCKDCGGASICQHQRQRSQCKECGGAESILPQQRRRSTFKGVPIANHRGWARRWRAGGCRGYQPRAVAEAPKDCAHSVGVPGARRRRRRQPSPLPEHTGLLQQSACQNRSCAPLLPQPLCWSGKARQCSRGPSRLCVRCCRPPSWCTPLPRWSRGSPRSVPAFSTTHRQHRQHCQLPCTNTSARHQRRQLQELLRAWRAMEALWTHIMCAQER